MVEVDVPPLVRAPASIFVKAIPVPLAAALVWILVVQGSAKRVERVFLTICLVYFAYVVSAFFAKPDWLIALFHLIPPQLTHFVPSVRAFVEVPPFNAAYAVILAGLVGTSASWRRYF